MLRAFAPSAFLKIKKLITKCRFNYAQNMALDLYLCNFLEKWASLRLKKMKNRLYKSICIEIYIMTCQINENSFHFKMMHNKPSIINLKKKKS